MTAKSYARNFAKTLRARHGYSCGFVKAHAASWRYDRAKRPDGTNAHTTGTGCAQKDRHCFRSYAKRSLRALREYRQSSLNDENAHSPPKEEAREKEESSIFGAIFERRRRHAVVKKLTATRQVKTYSDRRRRSERYPKIFVWIREYQRLVGPVVTFSLRIYFRAHRPSRSLKHSPNTFATKVNGGATLQSPCTRPIQLKLT